MELDKEYIYHCLLFRFYQKKNADAYRIIYETYSENVILEHVRIDLNDLKMVISISVTKFVPNAL